MRIYFLAIMALGFPASSEGEIECACQMPNQMQGHLELVMRMKNTPTQNMLGRAFLQYEIDRDLQRARIYPNYNGYNESLFIQDLQNNTIYRFPNPDDPSQGECTSTNLTAEVQIPSCRPKGWRKFGSYVKGLEKYIPPWKGNNRFRMHTGTCKPFDVELTLPRNSTANVTMYAYVSSFELLITKDFFPNTDRCIHVDYESFYPFRSHWIQDK